MTRKNPILDQLKSYPQQALGKLKRELYAQGVEVLDFGVGDPIEETPAFIREALRAAVAPRCGYPQVVGATSLRRSIAGYIQRRLGVSLNPDSEILPLSGAKEGVFHMPLAVIDPSADDNVVLFPDPGYSIYHRSALFAGAEARAIPLSGDYQFRPWELEPELLKRTRLLWLNTPHNPSGAVMSLEALQKTADLCRAYDILCVSDETYMDIYQKEAPHSLIECGLENVLVVHSLSKRSGMTGYRSGFIAGDPKWIELLRVFRANPGVVPQNFVNAAAEVAWADDTHVEERRAIFQAKKNVFLNFFDEMGWSYLGEEASFYLWLKAPNGASGSDLAFQLLEQGIVVSPGEMFSLNGRGAEYIRLALVPDLEGCQLAVEKWKELCASAQ